MASVSAAIQAVWREVAVNTRKWALVGAGVSNSAVSVLIISIISEARWAQAPLQLGALKLLGIIFSCTNAIVVISLAGVGVKGTGLGGMGFDVHADGSVPLQAHVEGDVAITPPEGSSSAR